MQNLPRAQPHRVSSMTQRDLPLGIHEKPVPEALVSALHPWGHLQPAHAPTGDSADDMHDERTMHSEFGIFLQCFHK